MKHAVITCAPRAALVALGFSCICTQLVLMRESVAAFSGNEIVLGLVLGFWLLLMGAGAWLGRYSERIADRLRAFAILQMLLAFIPAAQVFLLRLLRDAFFPRGAEVGVAETVLSCAALLLPYCLLAGFALALGCALLAESRGTAGIASGYILDSIGTILGGLLFSLVLVRFYDHFRLLAFPAALNFLAVALLGLHAGRRQFAWISLLLAMALVAGFSLFDLDAVSSRFQLPGQRILARANSPYGRLLVGESDGQINFLENGVVFTSTRDELHVEESVHYAMAQRPDAGGVLLVSGGISGTGLEVLKYPVKCLDYVELDPLVLELAHKFLPGNLANERLHVINTDARLYLKEARSRYQVIIVDLPAPSTAQLNRFYTAEFMAEAKRALAPNGVLSFALGNYENYLSPELARLLSCARRTLQTVFTNVLVLPGGRVFFLASDGPLDASIATRLEACGIRNQLVNRHYLGAMLTPDRLAAVAQGSSQPAPLNTDLSPVLYYFHLRRWMSQFSFSFGLLPLLFLLGICAWLARMRGNSLALCASGFAGSSLELVVLLSFQALCGSVYHQLALIVTSFMAGLAIGAYLAGRRAGIDDVSGVEGRSPLAARNPVAWCAFALAAYSLLLPVWLRGMGLSLGSPAAVFGLKAMSCLITAILGGFIGAQFSVASRRESGNPGQISSRLFAADFLGAFLGAVLAGTLLVPLIGVVGVCLLTCFLNALAGVVCLGARTPALAVSKCSL